MAQGDLVHDYPGRVEGLGGRMVRVTSLDGNQPTPAVGNRFVVPVLGVGQRGPEVIHVSASTKAFFQDVRLFSAPLFSTYISANKGPLTFSRVSIQPKPGLLIGSSLPGATLFTSRTTAGRSCSTGASSTARKTTRSTSPRTGYR